MENKISIVIPVLRGDINVKYTELCVSSLRKNSNERHELILVINGGDTTGVKEFQNLKVSVMLIM